MSLDRFASLFLAAAAAWALSGCGGEGDGARDEQSAAGEAQTPPAAQTAALEPGNAETGVTAYATYCSACHGKDATGIEGLGKALTNSEFIQAMADEEFLEYVNTGRALDDPRNTTGIPMPPKGGNPALTDQEIMHIIAYVRTLQ